MTPAITIPVSILGYYVIWLVTTRFYYRHAQWHRYTSESDRRAESGFIGFIWPIFIVVMLVMSIGTVISKVMTAPSLKERREIKQQQARKRQEEIIQGIKQAESELRKTGWTEE